MESSSVIDVLGTERSELAPAPPLSVMKCARVMRVRLAHLSKELGWTTALTAGTSLSTIQLDSCRMDDTLVQAIATTAPKLHTLHLQDVQLNQGSAKAIAEGLQGKPVSLTDLSLADNPSLQKLGVASLAPLLRNCSLLQRLDLRNVGMSDEALLLIVMPLSLAPRFRGVRTLNLSRNGITSAGVMPLAAMVRRSECLRELALDDNPLEDQGAVALAHGIASSPCLNVLSLVRCRIGAAGGAELGSALRWNDSLQHLALHGNDLTDPGIEGLALGLAVNTAIKTLRLGEINCGYRGAALLGHAVAVHPSVTDLRLGGNPFGDAGARLLSSALAEQPKLARLHLYDCGLTTTAACALAVLVGGSPFLKELDLRSNDIDLEGQQIIASALKNQFKCVVLGLESTAGLSRRNKNIQGHRLRHRLRVFQWTQSLRLSSRVKR